jgi:hypothetical protein
MTENRVLLDEPQDYTRKDDGLIEITSTGIDRIIRERTMGQDAAIEVDKIEVVVLRAR